MIARRQACLHDRSREGRIGSSTGGYGGAKGALGDGDLVAGGEGGEGLRQLLRGVLLDRVPGCNKGGSIETFREY